ncbi:MAG: FAD-dependent oxidoreductase, partial [Clostridia bacterium]|nr:FAD-dependent oxidoreductase [Clostridia bacterium]
KLAGVDWQAVRRALAADGDAGTDADARSAWGFWREARRYRPGSERLRLRGLNLGRQRDGSVLVNALQIFGVNGLDASSYREGYGLACREVPRVVSFLRQNIPGFGRARLAGTAPELYIRETRHIKGEYLLTLDDVLGNRCFPDQIAVASYPVDVQATNPSNYGWVFGRPKMYG